MSSMTPEPLPAVVPAEALREIEAGAVLLDVRERNEWTAGHAPQAVLIPMSEINSRLDELPREGRVVVTCRSGNRSQAVVRFLVGQGVDAVNLDGGMKAWHAVGGELVADNGSPVII